MGGFPVCKKTLQEIDGNGLVHIPSPADLFAGPGTEPACDAGERVLPTDKGQGLVKLSF